MNKQTTFMKRWLPTIIALVIIIALVVGWAYLWYVIGYHNSKIDLTQQLNDEYELRLQAEINELTIANTPPEDDEQTKAINNLTDYMEELIAGYAMNSNINYEGRYAIGWCFIARYVTKGYFGVTPQEILEKPNQWQWYDPNNPVRPEDTAIARMVATAFINKQYPYRYTTDLCFAELKGDGTVELRNQLDTKDKSVKYWTYEAN